MNDGLTTVDFGSAAIGGSESRTFTVKNLGASLMSGVSVSVIGAASADYSVTSPPAGTVPGPAGSTTFVATFSPTVSGTRASHRDST